MSNVSGIKGCKCDFRTYMVGDGCDACNPALALEYARETISELEQQRDELLAALKGMMPSVTGYCESMHWPTYDKSSATARELISKIESSK